MASQPEPGRRDGSLGGVTHVFFDVDGTLVASSPTAVEIFRKALAKEGHLLEPGMLSRTLRSPELIVTLIRPMVHGGENQFYRSVNARLMEHLGLAPDEAALDDIRESFEREIVYRPYPDAIRALKALRSAGYRTGVVSNFSHRLPRVLEDAGLASHLDTVTYSFEAGAEKPHPRIYRSALARAGASPERVLMVGDSYEADYLGARQAGMHAALLCREGSAPHPCPCVRSLVDVQALLGRHDSRP